jgi:hypothetical protein
MQSIDWRRINWPSVLLHALYVWVVGIAATFLGSVFGLSQSPDFFPAITLIVALATIWASYRVAMRSNQQPMVHGFLVGLLVALPGLILNLFSIGLGVLEMAGFLLQLLGGLLGGRMAQRVLQRQP